MPTIHGVNLSPFVRKVRVALAEKGVDYEVKPVFPAAEELASINPLKKIPVYEEDGFSVPDSSVIISYLERKYPQPPLHPSDDRQFAQALFLEEYADTKLLEATLPFFVQNVINTKFMGGKADPAALAAAREAQETVFPYLESRIGSSARDGIIGGRFTVADIAVASPFVNMQHGGAEIDAARWPKLAAYVAGVHARPSFKPLIEEEKAGIPG